MNNETAKKLSEFNIFSTEEILVSQKYHPYEKYLRKTPSGEGMVGENSYLLLWKKSEIEELNEMYETEEFLSDVILIGSDRGDTAYGIDVKGRYVEVPFIGMDDEEVKIIGENFDEFINYVWDNNAEDFFQYLDEIIGKPICAMGRAANMLWIGIGEKFATTNWRGEAVEKSTYALHVQTGWRIVSEAKKEVLLTAYDMYSPRTGMPYDEDFEWEPQGNNLFDEKCQSWLERELPVYIRRYDINQWGDLMLWLSNEEVLQVFNTSSDDSECWRLFMPGKDRPHLVAYPAKMELE